MGFEESFLSAGKVKKQISKTGSCVPWRPWVLLWEYMRPGALVSILRSWSERLEGRNQDVGATEAKDEQSVGIRQTALSLGFLFQEVVC